MSELGAKLMQQQIKTILASLADKDIRKIIDRYLDLTGERIEKTCHEISYKCYEASSTIRNKRANGFGRNEPQATLNSIKNLLELLLEDERSVAIIKECIKKSILCVQSTDIEHIPTEEDKENVVKIQLDMSKYERKSTGSKVTQPLSNNSNFMNTSTNDDLNRSKSRLKAGLDNISISTLKLANSTQPNISLPLEKTQSNIEKGPSAISYEEELKKAKAHIAHLEAKLKSILDENAMLKIQLQKAEVPSRKDTVPAVANISYDKVRSTSVEGGKPSNTFVNTSIIGDTNSNLNTSLMDDKKKSKVPRLKLEILPNYHGKSNKCINQSLLAAYQDKHGGKKS